jgi:hypothetical protein
VGTVWIKAKGLFIWQIGMFTMDEFEMLGLIDIKSQVGAVATMGLITC